MPSKTTGTSSATIDSPTPKPRRLIPTTPPITLLSTSTAHTYTHIHPILLLLTSTIIFPHLVSSPVPTLLSTLPLLATLQCLHATLCLPPHRSAPSKPPPSTTANTTQPPPRRWKPPPSRFTLSGLLTQTLLPLLPTTLLSTPLLFTLLILFGAPLTTHTTRTLLLAAHMALLAVYPLFYAYGVDGATWREIAAGQLAFDEVWGGTVGTVVGAWLGAVPVPLDWDREWQKWPVTIVTGAYAGYVVGRVAGELLLRGKRISFEETE
ncbi:Glycosylphosphatidylinositol (GPI) anchor assembly protein [Loxospora ochrophaea]|nr:Glycosylphosphatidylinositol (GPI) anchor assembly protein [Loxospora ochrophaea]